MKHRRGPRTRIDVLLPCVVQGLQRPLDVIRSGSTLLVHSRFLLRSLHSCYRKRYVLRDCSLEPENLQPQNRCFVRGFRQFSARRTKCHDCHGICTLSPLDAALPMRFAKNTQHDTSKVLRLPRKMTMDTSKVLRLPRKLQHIF